MIFKKIIISTVVFSLLVLPVFGVLAQNSNLPTQPPAEDYKLPNPLGNTDTLLEFLDLIVDAAMNILIPIIVLMIIYVGFLFVKARGNDKEITEAKKMFFYVIIGAAIILGAKLIIEIVKNTINSLKP